MSRFFLFISYSFIVFFLATLAVACLPKNNTGQFIFINDSNELITHANVEVCDQLIEIKNIKPHEKFNGIFKIKGDSHYTVSVFFASGKKIRDKLGYVTHGFDFKHTIIVTDSNISMSDTKIE